MILLLFLTNKKNNLDQFNKTINENKSIKKELKTLQQEKKFFKNQEEKIQELTRENLNKDSVIYNINFQFNEEVLKNQEANQEKEDQARIIKILKENRSFNVSKEAMKNLNKLEQYIISNFNFDFNIILEISFDKEGKISKINNFSTVKEIEELKLIEQYSDEELSNCTVLLKFFNEEEELRSDK